jgi:phage terminase large subunit-like protein
MADATNHGDSKEFVDRASTLDGESFDATVKLLVNSTNVDDFTVGHFLAQLDTKFHLVRPTVSAY